MATLPAPGVLEMYEATASSSVSLPSWASRMIAAAVNCIEMEAIEKRASVRFGMRCSRSSVGLAENRSPVPLTPEKLLLRT
jgi:hypothetical protein